jgi:hypothetical protein
MIEKKEYLVILVRCYGSILINSLKVKSGRTVFGCLTSGVFYGKAMSVWLKYEN